MPLLSGRPSGMRKTKGGLSSPLTLPTVLMLFPWLQRSSALYRVHASAVKTPLRGLLPANSNPVTLDEIKSRKETEKYASIDAVREGLGLYFEKYNMKGSPIWKDVKRLHVCWRNQSVVYVMQPTSFGELSTRNTSD